MGLPEPVLTALLKFDKLPYEEQVEIFEQAKASETLLAKALVDQEAYLKLPTMPQDLNDWLWLKLSEEKTDELSAFLKVVSPPPSSSRFINV